MNHQDIPHTTNSTKGQATTKVTPTLEQVLRRNDVWRGHSRAFIPQAVISSGIESFDKALLNGGWPTGKLIECCLCPAIKYRQSNKYGTYGGEWQLLNPLIQTLCLKHSENYVILLNPPAIPFAPALIQAGIPLNQLLVTHTKNKQDFIACFIEFTRSAHCAILLAWQTTHALSYTELRKCQLACTEGKGMYTLFRPQYTRQQNSPAPLRLALTLTAAHLQLEIFKQRGALNKREVFISLPDSWQYSSRTENPRTKNVLRLPASTAELYGSESMTKA